MPVDRLVDWAHGKPNEEGEHEGVGWKRTAGYFQGG